MHSHLDVLSTCSAPSISRLTARRTSVTEFEVTLQLQYLGSSNITSITLCYRQDSNLATNTTCIDDLEWQVGSTLLLRTLTVDIDDTFIRNEEVEFSVVVVNTAALVSGKTTVMETLGEQYSRMFIHTCDLLYQGM